MSEIIRADLIPGMMAAQQLGWLGDQALAHQRVVEIGCWRGRSTRALCDNCFGKVTAVDTWEGSAELKDELEFMRSVTGNPDWLFLEFSRNLSDAANLEIFRMPSTEAASVMASEGRTFDFIFIDGAHDYESVQADLRAWFPLLEIGGMLSGHDFLHPPVAQAVRNTVTGFPENWDKDIWAMVKVNKP